MTGVPQGDQAIYPQVGGDPISSIMTQLTSTHISVLRELHGELGMGPSHISAALNITVAQARISLRTLYSHGLCNYGHLISEYDGLLQGKGYWRVELGDRLLSIIDDLAGGEA